MNMQVEETPKSEASLEPIKHLRRTFFVIENISVPKVI